ncbi:hypothetical protein FOZ61_005371 [Perkinsus olseni]|uniref:D-lactate dehydrogenase (cytochrome) n=1 Tax=Perkinsus olseni TaxID=32597 RepID=A0A7J6MHU5_PEROL|nr:hypothetical protein FOZ61_005371 [Perkinsus olseni]
MTDVRLLESESTQSSLDSPVSTAKVSEVCCPPEGKYGEVTSEFLDKLREVPELEVSVDEDSLQSCARDKSYHLPHRPTAVLHPSSTSAVSGALALCYEYRIPVATRGAGTGLEGGAILARGLHGVVLSTEKLKTIDFDETSMSCWVGAGVRKTQLNKYLNKFGCCFQCDPGSDASIGGQASTGASGTTSVRYGTFKENVVSLTVVTPSGDVIENTRRLVRKNSTGLDLTRLYLGSEGSLGVITKVCVKVTRHPKVIAGGIICFPSVEKAVEAVLEISKSNIPDLSRGELMTGAAVRQGNAFFGCKYTELPSLCFECQCSDFKAADRACCEVMDIAKTCGGTDIRATDNKDALDTLWTLRRGAFYSTKNTRRGEKGISVFVSDACVPLVNLPKVITETENIYQSIFHNVDTLCIVAHIFDGNFHAMIPTKEDEVDKIEEFSDRLADIVLEAGGSVSGEHGVGLGKARYVEREFGTSGIKVMQRVKEALDPRGIMNPGKSYYMSSKLQLKRGPQRAFIKDRCLAWAPVVTNAHSVLGKVYMAGVDDIGMDLLLVTEPRTRIHESYCELVCHALVDEILSDGDLVGRLQEFVERIDAQVTVSEDYTVESMCSEGHGAYELPQADSVVVDKVKGVFLCIHWLTLFYFKIICTVHDRVRSISRGLGEVLELSARTCDAVLGALVYGPAKSVALERWVVNPGGEGMTIHLLLSHKEEKEDATDGLRWALLDVTENFPELPVGYHAVLVFDSAESLLKAEAMETSNTVMKLDLGSLNNDGESTVPATARDVHPVIPSATPREAGELVVENTPMDWMFYYFPNYSRDKVALMARQIKIHFAIGFALVFFVYHPPYKGADYENFHKSPLYWYKYNKLERSGQLQENLRIKRDWFYDEDPNAS